MEADKRIDKGIKRQNIDRRPKAAASGQFISSHTPEQRQSILSDSYERLARGESTDQIGASHGLPGSTLRYWLLDDPNADAARRQMINGELIRTLTEMKDSGDPLALARGREEFRAWSWIAERREHRLYGQRQHIELETQPLSAVDKELLGSAQELLQLIKEKRQQVVIEPNAALLQDDSASKEGSDT